MNSIWGTLGGLLVAVGAAPTPASELALAVADLQSQVPPQRWSVTRYVSLYSVAEGQRREAAATVSLVLNSVSRTAVIARPDEVPGSEGRLWRFELDRYGLPPAAWEGLLGDEPYWHLRTKVLDPRGKKPREVLTDGGWVGLDAAATLRRLTQSAGALVRGDWLVSHAAVPPAYYALAGVPEKEAEFFSSLGLDVQTINDLRADGGANLLYSQVTYKLRRIARRQGPLGGAWQTYDVERNTPERDPLRNPLEFTYDAGEHIARQKNGLHVFALYDSAGRRQDEVPARIARDHADRLGSGLIVPMLSCVRCHVEDGLRGFTNDQRTLLAEGVELFTERPEDAERLTAFYETNLGKSLTRDREDYAEAMAAATGGQSVREAAAALARLYEGYASTMVDLPRATRELGLDEGEFATRMRGSRDAVILALCEGLAVQRGQWESAFAEAAVLAMEDGT